MPATATTQGQKLQYFIQHLRDVAIIQGHGYNSRAESNCGNTVIIIQVKLLHTS